ncbi:uncharacterized protein BDR25DRAFT_14790 [Lindgomyces ingoldianus]|uniref:Uncharacterized protein n=1 Tax=Lindgomyces ingoldianus TaxID=673940 RepID=A0ACB6QZT4_9PLEO|nr:uncharacterized protein BDR25DRAFT_14790 [Lindgomyces ingoldianus]KAF2472499.1 hypothetical protein BDR25DRAFT_14790 [Lindgomyces ingoldianus]
MLPEASCRCKAARGQPRHGYYQRRHEGTSGSSCSREQVGQGRRVSEVRAGRQALASSGRRSLVRQARGARGGGRGGREPETQSLMLWYGAAEGCVSLLCVEERPRKWAGRNLSAQRRCCSGTALFDSRRVCCRDGGDLHVHDEPRSMCLWW